MELRSASVLVTGGRGGLGSRVCEAFLAEGANVLSADIIPTDSGRLVNGAKQFQADASTTAGARSAVDAAAAEFGRLDVLANVAGINQWVDFSDLDGMTDELWQRILQVDLTGPWLCSKAAAPVMRRQQRGRIVSVASIAGLKPAGSSIAYAIAKAGVIHMTRCLAVALGPYVLVNAVAPGVLLGTGMTANLSPEFIERNEKAAALQRTPSLQDVAAQMVAFARSDSITGQTVAIDAGVVFH